MNEIKVYVIDRGRSYLQLRYTDPMTGKAHEKSAKTANRREADKAAGVWEDELKSGRYAAPCNTSWSDFRERYEREVFPRLAPRTAEPRTAVMEHIERAFPNLKRLSELNADRLSHFEGELRKAGLADSTIAGHLAHLRSILAWAVEIGVLRSIPKIRKPTRNVGSKMMRGRPVTTEEYERLLTKVEAGIASLYVPSKQRKQTWTLERKARHRERRRAFVAERTARWKRYLTGLWLSGLRLEESLKLSWDADAEIMVDLSGRFPRLRIYAEAEKGHRDRHLPMTPDFAEWLLKTPESERSGLVFPLAATCKVFKSATMEIPESATVQFGQSEQLDSKTVSRVVSAIGKAAGVVVNKAAGKFASAHDLRRAFGTRWASKVKPATLQLLMRHASIQTTLDYYVAMDADDVAAELWSGHSTASPTGHHPPNYAGREP